MIWVCLVEHRFDVGVSDIGCHLKKITKMHEENASLEVTKRVKLIKELRRRVSD